MPRVFLAVGVALALALVGGCKKQGAGKATIAVIPKGTTHEFWRSVDAGAEQAGKDLGVDIVWRGPVKEDDREAQIKTVEQAVSNGVSGIVLAPLDSRGLLDAVQTANAQKIPVVIIDSALDGQVGKDFVSFVATDNEKGGAMAAAELARLLGDKGKVYLLRYAEGSASTLAREKGFMEEIARHHIDVISTDDYAGATTESAQQKVMSRLSAVKEADGIFASNESATAGMLAALRSTGLAGKAKFVGFDASPALIDAMKNKEINALIAQDPYRIGYEGVKAMVDHLHGQAVPERVDTGVHLITPDTLNAPEIQKILGH